MRSASTPSSHPEKRRSSPLWESSCGRRRHEKLMVLVRERIADGSVLRLLWAWLRAGYQDVDGAHRPTPQGVPQGGPLSPLLSNVYLNLLDRLWERRGYTEKFGATL